MKIFMSHSRCCCSCCDFSLLPCMLILLDLSIKASSDLQEVKSDDDDAKTVEFVVMMEETLERLETAVGILESSSL